MLTSMPRPVRLPLNTLPAFRAVAELQNLRAAAEVLHLTHSAVSQQIRGLEEQLGFQLFERRGRRVVLNPAGEALLRSVQAALAQLDDGVQAAAAAASGAAQRLRVTVLPSFAQRWLLPRMGRWRERHPELALEIDASQQLVDLQREGFHAALRHGSGPWAGPGRGAPVRPRRCRDRRRLAVGGATALGRAARGVRARAAAGRRATSGTHWFKAAGVRTQVTPVAVFNDAGLMLQAAEQNLGLALSRELLAADALARRPARAAVAALDHVRADARLPSRVSAQPARLAAARVAARMAARRARAVAPDAASAAKKRARKTRSR